MSSVIPALINPHVFACHCEVEGTILKVGILALGEEFTPGLNTLFTLNGERACIVNIPESPTLQYNTTVPIWQFHLQP